MPPSIDHDYTFNPDGSGRVAFRWSFSSEEDPGEPDAMIRQEVEKGRGIEAWEAVDAYRAGDRVVLEGSVLFRDVSELRFHCQGNHVTTMDLVAAPAADGGLEVAMQAGPSGSDVFPEDVPPDADLAALVAEQREKLGEVRGFLAAFFGGFRSESVIHLPGDIGELVRGERIDDRTVCHVLEGESLLAALDELLEDEEHIATLIRMGGAEREEALMGVLGAGGPIRVTTTGPLEPAFDLDEAATAARASFAETAEEMAVPAGGGTERAESLANARVVAMKCVREVDSDRGLQPMGQNFTSLVFAIAGDLPAPVLRIEEGLLEAAVADTGEDLAPEDEWSRRISFPKTFGEGTAAILDVDLPLPGPEVGGFREIRGVVRCVVASGAEDVDLGFARIAEGEAGTALGAFLERVEADDGGTGVELKVEAARDTIETVAAMDAGGAPLPTEIRGYSSWGEECTLSIRVEGALPPDGRILARVATGMRAIEVPFEVRDVDLMGRGGG